MQNLVKCTVLHRLPLINLFLRSYSGHMSQAEFNELTVQPKYVSRCSKTWQRPLVDLRV